MRAMKRDPLSKDGKVLGRFAATGIRPKCSDRLAASGLQLPPQLFDHVQSVQ